MDNSDDYDFDSDDDEQCSVGMVSFTPKDHHLVAYFLRNKILGNNTHLLHMFIMEADVYSSHPAALPWEHHPLTTAGYRYYFLRRPNLSANRNGNRATRTIDCGWWRADTGDKKIFRRGKVVGLKKTLSFFVYKDQAKKRNEALKSGWIMHEFRLCGGDDFQQWLLCKIYNKPTKKKIAEEANGPMVCDTSTDRPQPPYEKITTEETNGPMVSATATDQPQSPLPEVNQTYTPEDLLKDNEYVEWMGQWLADFLDNEDKGIDGDIHGYGNTLLPQLM